MKKILVTGGAGYIGTILIPKLLQKGYKVTLFDNFTWGLKPILGFATHENLRIVKGDIRDIKRNIKRDIMDMKNDIMDIKRDIMYIKDIKGYIMDIKRH